MESNELALAAGGLSLPLLGSGLGAEAFMSGDRLAAKSFPKIHSPEQLARLRELLGVTAKQTPVYHDLTRYQNSPGSGMLYDIQKRPVITERGLQQLDLMDADTGRRLPPGVRALTAREMAKGNPTAAILMRNPNMDVATLAHELGHATRTNKGLVSSLREIGDRLSRPIASSSPAAGPLRYALAASPLIMDSDNPYLYAPAAALALTDLPLLAEEATATGKGLGALKKMVARGEPTPAQITKPQYSAAKKVLARMFGSYALPALGIVGSALGLAALKDK